MPDNLVRVAQRMCTFDSAYLEKKENERKMDIDRVERK